MGVDGGETMSRANHDAEFQRAIFDGKVRRRSGFDWSTDREYQAFSEFRERLAAAVATGLNLSRGEVWKELFEAEKIDGSQLSERNRAALANWIQNTKKLLNGRANDDTAEHVR
jgi:hypothetical protein